MIKPIKLTKEKYIETIFQRKGEILSIEERNDYWTVNVKLKSTLVICGTYNAFTLVFAEPSNGKASYVASNEKVQMYMDAGIIY